jgi:hypothetical protein
MFEGKNKLVLGLPGNPVSATVTSHLYVLPAIRKMSGYTAPLGTIVKATVSIWKCLNKQENSGFDLNQNRFSSRMRVEAMFVVFHKYLAPQLCYNFSCVMEYFSLISAPLKR